MNGVLLIDKPSGPTSHDVVARIRHVVGQHRVGHTGTLDPSATGLLPLMLGRATKLASLLTGGDKTYEAAIRLGVRTETDDAEGRALEASSAPLPSDDAVDAALDGFRGVFDQVPPRHSAKKIEGRRAYDLARRATPVELRPVAVTVRSLERLRYADDLVHVRVTAAAGFYVRALARDLGNRLGCGGHLAALRRTHSGPFGLAGALPLDVAERLSGPELGSHLLAPADALPHLAVVSVTEAGLRRAVHGNLLSPEHLNDWRGPEVAGGGPVRVLAPDGRLVALALPKAGALHPVVVLG